jgi:hypothetical protein
LPPTAPRRRRPQGGKVLDPEWRRQRGRRARAAQDDPDRLIAKLVKSANTLNPEQAEAIRALLPSDAA